MTYKNMVNLQEAVNLLKCDICEGNFGIYGEDLIRCSGCGKEVAIINKNIFQFEKNDISKDIMENTMYGPEKDELKKELFEEKPNWLLIGEKIRISNNPIVLDYGCGSSRQVFDFANYFKSKIIFGLDFDLDPLIISSQMAEESGYNNIFFVQYSSENIPFKDNVFDIVSAHQVLEHLSDPERAVREISKKMKKRALFEADFPNGHSLGEIMRCVFHKIIKKNNPHVSRINLKRANKMFTSAHLEVIKCTTDQIFSGPVIYFYEGLFMRFLKKKNKLWNTRKKFKDGIILKNLIGFEDIFSIYFPALSHNLRYLLVKNNKSI